MTSEAPTTVTPLQSVWAVKMSSVGAAIVALAVLAAVIGPVVAPFDTASQDLALRLTGPSLRHWFGLDELGRDILSRVLAGARISLLVGLVVVSISAAVGIARRRRRGLLRRPRGRDLEPHHRRPAGVSRAAAGDRDGGGARPQPVRTS